MNFCVCTLNRVSDLTVEFYNIVKMSILHETVKNNQQLIHATMLAGLEQKPEWLQNPCFSHQSDCLPNHITRRVVFWKGSARLFNAIFLTTKWVWPDTYHTPDMTVGAESPEIQRHRVPAFTANPGAVGLIVFAHMWRTWSLYAVYALWHPSLEALRTLHQKNSTLPPANTSHRHFWSGL